MNSNIIKRLSVALLFVALLVSTHVVSLPAPVVQAADVDLQVSLSTDDVHETKSNGGSLYHDWNTHLRFGEPSGDTGYNTWVGVRFNNVSIPQGANIVEAWLDFRASSSDSASVSFTIYGHDHDDSPTFSDATGESGRPGARTVTSASVSWSPGAWTANTWYQTYDIADIIKEIVDRPGWSSGSDLSLLIDTSATTLGNLRRANSYDDASTRAPKLHVMYTTQTFLDRQVGSSSDDAREFSDGNCSTTSNAAVLGDYNGTSDYAGFRFTNITIPQGAKIHEAYLKVRAYSTKSGGYDFYVAADDVDDSVTFDCGNNSPRDRTTTTATVLWDPVAWSAGIWYKSPDIAAVVQEVVDRGNWSSGNDLSIIILDDGQATGYNYRQATSYDNGSSYGAKLRIFYNEGPTAPTLLYCEGATNPTGVIDTTPEFSAIGNDPNSGDTLTHAYVQVGTTAGGSDMWDSGWQDIADFTEGNRSADVSYNGSALDPDTTYYWRTKFKDDDGAGGAWSSNAQFTTKEAYYIEPASRSVTASSTYTFEVKAAHADAFDAYDIVIGFEPDTATVDDISDAGWLNSASQAGKDIDSNAGTVEFGAYSTGTDVSGSGTLATFTVTAQANGTFTPALLAAKTSAGHTSDFVRCSADLPWDNSSATGDPYSECDGEVDVEDIMRVAARWDNDCTGGTYPSCTGCDADYDIHADYDGDCDITVVDIMQVVAHWGEVAPTINLQIQDTPDTSGGHDDAYLISSSGNPTSSNTYNTTTISMGTKSDGNELYAGFIFRTVPLEYGSVITEAYLILEVSSATTPVTLEVFTEDNVGHFGLTDRVKSFAEDNAGHTIAERLVDKYPGTGSYCNSDSDADDDYCGLWIEWEINSTGTVTSPNLAIIIQEAIGRADWHKNDVLSVLVRPKSTNGSGKYATVQSYEGSAANAAKLRIKWVENGWNGWDEDIGPADDRLPLGATVAHLDRNDLYDDLWDNMNMQAGFEDEEWRDTLTSTEKADAVNLCWGTTINVNDVTVGSPLGYGDDDAYYHAQQDVDNNGDADIFNVSPDNEEDTYTDYGDSCYTDVGASYAGDSSSDDDCDEDGIPDPIEYVYATAKAFIGVKAKDASLGTIGLMITYDGDSQALPSSATDPLFLKKVLDYGIGAFFDIANYHFYPAVSCWVDASDKLHGDERRSSRNTPYCNAIPPDTGDNKDAWGLAKALENPTEGGYSYSDGYAGYTGSRKKYIGTNEIGKTATPNNTAEEATQAKYVYKHFAQGLSAADEALQAYVIWFSYFDYRTSEGKSYGLVLCEYDDEDPPIDTVTWPCDSGDTWANGGITARPSYYAAWAFAENLGDSVTVSKMTTGPTSGSFDLPSNHEGYKFYDGSVYRAVIWNKTSTTNIKVDVTSYVRIARSTDIQGAEYDGVSTDYEGIGWAKCYDGSWCYDERGSGGNNDIWRNDWDDQGTAGRYELYYDALKEPIMIWSDDNDIDITW